MSSVVFNPYVRELSEALVKKAAAAGIPVKIGETVRTWARQQELYNQGRVAPNKHLPIVTKAQPGYSWHNWGLAFDFCINISNDAYNIPKMEKVGALGESLGLEWGGRWKDFVDRPHFQYTYGLSLSALNNGARIPERPNGQTYVNSVLPPPPKTASDFVKNKEYDMGVGRTSVGTIDVKGDTYVNVSQLAAQGVLDLGFNQGQRQITLDSNLSTTKIQLDVSGITRTFTAIVLPSGEFVLLNELSSASVLSTSGSGLDVSISTR